MTALIKLMRPIGLLYWLRALYAVDVRLSVTQVDQSETVEVRIMQFPPVCGISFIQKF